MFKKTVFATVKYIFSIGLMAFIILRVDLNATLQSMKGINLFPILYSLLFMAFGTVIRSYKWKLLLNVRNIEIPFLTVLDYNMMSEFFNNLFLGSLGGDAFRIYRSMGYSDSIVRITSSVIIDRITGFLIALFLSIFFGIWVLTSYKNIISFNLLTSLIIFTIIIMILIFCFYTSISRLTQVKMLERYQFILNGIEKANTSMLAYKKSYKAVLIAMLLSVLYYLSQGAKIYYLSLAIHPDVSILPFFFISPLVGIIRMIPITINGVGIQEGSLVFYLERIGFDGPSAFLIAIMTRMSTLLFSLIGGILFLRHEWSHRQERMWVRGKSAFYS